MYDVLIAAPPCDQFSRALFSNGAGPRPIRNAAYPRGLPWNTVRDRARANISNLVHDRTWMAIEAAVPAGTGFLLEFPEFLGVNRRGTPATLWNDDALERKQSLKATSVAHYTCWWGPDRRNPIRAMSNVHQHVISFGNSLRLYICLCVYKCFLYLFVNVLRGFTRRPMWS